MTPAERTLRARIAANTRWAHAGADERKRQAEALHTGSMRRYEDMVDPGRTLSDDERSRRARSAEQAHMSRMALASSRARRRANA